MSRHYYPKYLLRVLLIAVIALNAQHALSQGMHTSVDKKDILIGEQINFRLDVDVPSADYKVQMDIPDSFEHFQVLQKSGSLLKDKKGNYSWEQKIVFTSFDSGSWRFPAMGFHISHLNTVSQPLSTDTFMINVGYMPIDPSGKPRDIKTIIEVSFTDWFWVWIAAGILLLLILLFILYRWYKKRKVAAPFKPAAGAYEEAMKRLAALKKANEERSLSVKEYHTALADVLKDYYTKTNRDNMLNKTSTEILDRLKTHELLAETQSHAAEALKTGDAVKFAKYHATYTENEAALNYLKTVIDEMESSVSKNNSKI